MVGRETWSGLRLNRTVLELSSLSSGSMSRPSDRARLGASQYPTVSVVEKKKNSLFFNSSTLGRNARSMR